MQLPRITAQLADAAAPVLSGLDRLPERPVEAVVVVLTPRYVDDSAEK
jgi:hypothetical protein